MSPEVKAEILALLARVKLVDDGTPPLSVGGYPDERDILVPEPYEMLMSCAAEWLAVLLAENEALLAKLDERRGLVMLPLLLERPGLLRECLLAVARHAPDVAADAVKAYTERNP